MKIGILSLGCRVNIYESEYIEELLKNHGYEITTFNDQTADIYIINTCSVTNESDKKSRQMINKAKRQNPHAKIIVMGCYSQLNADKIDADIIIGNKDKSQILNLIKEQEQKNTNLTKIYNIREENDFEDMQISHFDNHTRAFVKIQDGCNAFCSYCIIPYTRGKIRSKKKETVIKEVTDLVNNGYKDIILTGIHTGKYGLDQKNTNLEDLLKSLLQIKNLYRLRLSSIEINEVTDGILELMKTFPVLSSHMHIPLQSGSNKILKLMNRCYDLDYFIKRINQIKKIREDISITTDLIVGFPNETEEDFQETIQTLEKIKFTKIHVFPYSQRDNTKASTMPNQIDNQTKKNRVHKILELSKKYEHEYYSKFQNKVLEGVSETKKDNQTIIHTSNFIPIEVSKPCPNNSIIKVKITKVDENNIVHGNPL